MLQAQSLQCLAILFDKCYERNLNGLSMSLRFILWSLITAKVPMFADLEEPMAIVVVVAAARGGLSLYFPNYIGKNCEFL